MPQKILRQDMARPWAQPGGPRPNNPTYFYGVDTPALMIGAYSNPVRGGIDGMWQRAAEDNSFELVGTMDSPPDLPTAPVTFRYRVGSIPRHLLAKGCIWNFYMLHGECQSLADFNRGWAGFIDIYSNGRITDSGQGNDGNSFEGAEAIQDEFTFTFEGIYQASQMGFTERIASSITLEVLDVTYANKVVCGECGPSNDGTNWIYVVEKGGAAAKPIVWYSLDGGATWSSSSITTAANAEAPCAIRVMGNYLVVLSPTAAGATQGGYYYSAINTLTGAPSSTWTKVTTGFTNANEPRDMVVFGPREAYICCDSGEILKLSDVTAGAVSLGVVTSVDLSRIHGDSSSGTLVAVGASATVVKSINRGKSFVATTTSPGAGTVQAVHVFDRYTYQVGDSAGALYYTNDGGETWTAKSFAPPVAASAVQEVRYATPEVGYLLYTASSKGRMAVTLDGGQSWVASPTVNSRISGVNGADTAQRYNRIAVPVVADKTIAANSAVIGGLGASTDGALMVGVGSIG